jgi:alpha-tubulin suppressor-like RCC1 family protein
VSVTSIAAATSIATGGFHACAVVTGSSVKCWGYNGFGQLGDGTTTDSSIPVTVN